MTYELAVPDRRSKKRVLHINMLKAWKVPEANALMVIVADDEEDEPTQGQVVTVELTDEQLLQELLEAYKEILSATPGMITCLSHPINTGNGSPIRVPPYRLAPAWREQLQQEINVCWMLEYSDPLSHHGHLPSSQYERRHSSTVCRLQKNQLQDSTRSLHDAKDR